MKIDNFAEKNLLFYREYSNNVFSESYPCVVEFKTKRGLRGLHYNSDKGDENLIIAPAMGRHVHDQRLCKFFSAIGFNTTTFHYAGTYKSWDAGEFLPSAKGKLSVQEDLEEIIDILHAQEPVEILGPCFGGAIAVSVAAERKKQVNAVYLFAPMLYGSPKKRYKDQQDKSLELGKFKKYPRYRGTEKKDWYEKVWEPIIEGKTSLNAHAQIPALLQADTKVYGVACEQDKLISSKTLEDFAKAYTGRSDPNHAFFYIYEDEKEEPGHFGHYKLEYAPGAIKSFCQFIGKNPKKVLSIKKQIDLEFAQNAHGKLPLKNKQEETKILAGIKYLAESFYMDDHNHLRQIVKIEPSKVRQFALGFIKGIIL